MKLRKESEFVNNILNSQVNFVFITDGKDLKETNQKTLDFFGYKSLNDFHKEHNCICDFFVEDEGYLQKEQNGKNWLEVMLENKNTIYQVKIKDLKDNIHYFQTNTTGKKIKNNNYVITFTDVTTFNDQQKQLREKELRLHETEKMMSMGEMIGNIAHQWRQPLSVISTVASGTKMNYALGVLEDADIAENMDNIIKKTNYLSETIDVFRNYIKEEKELKEVILQERIDISLNIVGTTLKNKHINLINEINYNKPIKINLILGELSQVLMNILNNAKDILLERNIKYPWIKIGLKQVNDKAVITIEDNGGGIPEDILPKIFDPYFTTKHQSQGTGLGLHMSYKIITESLKGELYAKNGKDGAKFFIELPIDSQQ